jgi:hypothetical protein
MPNVNINVEKAPLESPSPGISLPSSLSNTTVVAPKLRETA